MGQLKKVLPSLIVIFAFRFLFPFKLLCPIIYSIQFSKRPCWLDENNSSRKPTTTHPDFGGIKQQQQQLYGSWLLYVTLPQGHLA